MITISHVYKKYGNSLALNDINLKLPRTGLVVIKGPSGCGKTTLLNVIAGLIDCSGDVCIDGKHINMMDDKSKDEYRLKNLGLIFQDFKMNLF